MASSGKNDLIQWKNQHIIQLLEILNQLLNQLKKKRIITLKHLIFYELVCWFRIFRCSFYWEVDLFVWFIFIASRLVYEKVKKTLLIQPYSTLSASSIASSTSLTPLVFTSMTESGYAHLDHLLVSVPESIEHRILRSRKSGKSQPEEFPFTARPAHTLHSLWTSMPQMMYLPTIKVIECSLRFDSRDSLRGFFAVNIFRVYIQIGSVWISIARFFGFYWDYLRSCSLPDFPC